MAGAIFDSRTAVSHQSRRSSWAVRDSARKHVDEQSRYGLIDSHIADHYGSERPDRHMQSGR